MCSARENKNIDKVWGVVEEYRTNMNQLNKVRGSVVDVRYLA